MKYRFIATVQELAIGEIMVTVILTFRWLLNSTWSPCAWTSCLKIANSDSHCKQVGVKFT
jgi:hypothetical protein